MTNQEKAMLWLSSFVKNKEPFTLIPKQLIRLIYEVLKEQEPQELSIQKWYEWKANSKRDPICLLWENDSTPMWILNPKDVHEPALLMGKIKLFNKKPTYEQCKAINWKQSFEKETTDDS